MFTKIGRGTCCAIAMLALAGCAVSRGPKFEMPTAPVNPGQARMILYVQNAGMAMFKQPTKVRVDGTELCTIDINEVLTVDLTPGMHVLAMDTRGTPGVSLIEFNAEEGKTIFVLAGDNPGRRLMSAALGLPGILLLAGKSAPDGGHFYVREVPESTAATDLQGLSVSECGRRPAAKNGQAKPLPEPNPQ